ncbi:transglycosylase domain-containing protein [Actinotalea sp. AC32]|nr:transglycosylase domain-containing protein [Actinotalea sp. AC32]
MSSASARPRGRQVNFFQALALLIAFLLMAGVGGVLAAGLVMPAVATTSVVTDTSVRLFDDLPSELEPQELSEQSRVWAADGSLLATFWYQNRIVVPLEEIAPVMQQAVVAVEDHRFWEHGGVDVAGMGRALMTNLTSDDTQGASTLTQQYVKNVLIETAIANNDVQAIQDARVAEGTAGIARKLQEAKMAIALEKRMTKEEILQGYLNIAQFGTSVYGVEAAARHYFSISAKDLSYLQAATIAGITQAPSANDPIASPEQSQARRNVVLGTMRAQDMITEEEYQAGIATPLADTLNVSDSGNNCQAAGGAAYFCDYVTKVILESPEFGETREDRRDLLFAGGLDIYTTIDLRMQAVADEEIRAAVPDTDPTGIGHALVSVEPGTGKILAMAQNRTYNPRTDPPPGPGESAINYNTDAPYGASTGFQVGSTFKPFVLAEWLAQGKSLNQSVDASSKEYKSRDLSASCIPGNPFASLDADPYEPKNVDGQGSGRMSVLSATANSVNTAYMNMASQLDYCGIVEMAKTIGFHRADGLDVEILPSTVLGAQQASPLTMASAYATFAANGTYCEPIAITRVTDSEGQELPVPSANCREVLDPAIASTVTYALQSVMTDGSGRRSQISGRPSAGKTGTTNENTHTWFVGYTPQVVSAVWLGNPDVKLPMQQIRINGQYYPQVYGGLIAAGTWDRYMTRALDGLPVATFAPPSNRLVQGTQTRVPDVDGRSVSRATSTLEAAGFTVRVSGTQEESREPAGSVARTQPAGGSRAAEGSTVTIVISNGQPPAEASGGDEDDRSSRGRDDRDPPPGQDD